MSSTERPPVRIGDLHLTYEQPFIDQTGGTNTVEHELLPTDFPGDPELAIQALGAKATELQLTGICTLDEANIVDTWNEGEQKEMRSHRYSGSVVVTDFDTSPRGGGSGGHARKKDQYLYDLTIDMIAITSNVEFGRSRD